MATNIGKKKKKKSKDFDRKNVNPELHPPRWVSDAQYNRNTDSSTIDILEGKYQD